MKILVLFDLPRPVHPDEAFTMEALREKEDRPTEADVITCLNEIGHEVDTLPVYDNVLGIVEKIRAFAPDVVFNLSESFYNERSNEPNIPALLELLKVPYTGAGPEALLLCKDKALAKTILVYHRIRVPRFVVSHKRRPLRTIRRFCFPAFVKPLAEESSDGIAKASFARNEEETMDRLRYIHEKLGCDAMIEEYIEGREVYVSVLGNRKLTVFPARELFFDETPDNAPKFATFRAKWNDAYRAKWGIRNGPAAPLAAGGEKKLAEAAKRVYSLLKIQGVGRIDFRLRPSGELVFIEANPNPSLAQEDDFAQSAITAGVQYKELIQRIIDAAGSR
ncbi:MAG TPA: ATP-grasp domain-containing protein [Bryobacteraceae bacterium]|nr:ATP-grasp domain-containing protein [Bryobacteraceae bacterium]